MEWNVFYHNVNARRIEYHNVFAHSGFKKDVEEYLNKYESREEFAEEMRKSMFYFYRAKCEWEVLVTPWIGNEKDKSIKVDVYQQVMMNWDKFVDYVWSHKGSESHGT